jgi:putative methylase
MKKKELEIALQTIPLPKTTNPSLEQYITPASIAADIIFHAHLNNDIHNKHVIDLGCGTAIFAIGAALTGAIKTTAIEIDPRLIQIAQTYSHTHKLNIDFIQSDIENITISADTILTNPPFGAQKPNQHADRKFLEIAYEFAPIIYSIHLSKTIPFIIKLITALNGTVTQKKMYKFPIKHQFSFHSKPIKYFNVTMIRSERKK